MTVDPKTFPLPPLPPVFESVYDDIDKTEVQCFSRNQTQAYARAAVEAFALAAGKSEPLPDPLPLPELGAGIVKHEKLGDLHDRLQVHQRMVGYADASVRAALAASTPPAPQAAAPANAMPIATWLRTLAQVTKAEGRTPNYSGEISRRLNEAADVVDALTVAPPSPQVPQAQEPAQGFRAFDELIAELEASPEEKAKLDAARAAVKESLTVEAQADMTSDRASFFLRRFKQEEKMLGPNEQKALDFAIAFLGAAPEPADMSAVTEGREETISAQRAIRENPGSALYIIRRLQRDLDAARAAQAQPIAVPAEPPPMTFAQHQQAWCECRQVANLNKASLFDRIEAVINARDAQWRAALAAQPVAPALELANADEALRVALDSADVPLAYRVAIVGFFRDEWNRSLAQQPVQQGGGE